MWKTFWEGFVQTDPIKPAAVVFVVDVSPSLLKQFGQTCVGDVDLQPYWLKVELFSCSIIDSLNAQDHSWNTNVLPVSSSSCSFHLSSHPFSISQSLSLSNFLFILLSCRIVMLVLPLKWTCILSNQSETRMMRARETQRVRQWQMGIELKLWKKQKVKLKVRRDEKRSWDEEKQLERQPECDITSKVINYSPQVSSGTLTDILRTSYSTQAITEH